VQKTVPPVSPNTELPKRTIEAILAPVQSGLEQVEQKMRGVDDTLFAPLASSFTKLVDSGGKRLRPALALMSAQLNGPLQGTSDYERVLASAASVEVLHTATLVHDDVIDEAKIRRGTATLNARWNEGTTVLAGNYMFGHSMASFIKFQPGMIMNRIKISTTSGSMPKRPASFVQRLNLQQCFLAWTMEP